MTDSQAAKRNIVKLQKAIVDGLENVKAQDLQVFDTEHITSLFERVIVASGTSNRQTKALAASVRDSVRQAGFDKPRTEGEDNGEWIIVDCGAAVVHIMQPSIRQYYHLEELWGDKPVRLKPATAPKTRAGAVKGQPTPVAAALPAVKKTASKKTVPQTELVKAELAKKAGAKTSGAKTAATKRPSSAAAGRSDPSAAAKTSAPKKSVSAKTPVKRTSVQGADGGSKPAKTSAVKKVVAKKVPAKAKRGP
jgi:ribosome-associated protein